MTHLEDAARHVRLIEAGTVQLEKQAVEMRQARADSDAAALEREAGIRRMWLADRFTRLAAIEAGLPPCCCAHRAEQETGT